MISLFPRSALLDTTSEDIVVLAGLHPNPLQPSLPRCFSQEEVVGTHARFPGFHPYIQSPRIFIESRFANTASYKWREKRENTRPERSGKASLKVLHQVFPLVRQSDYDIQSRQNPHLFSAKRFSPERYGKSTRYGRSRKSGELPKTGKNGTPLPLQRKYLRSMTYRGCGRNQGSQKILFSSFPQRIHRNAPVSSDHRSSPEGFKGSAPHGDPSHKKPGKSFSKILESLGIFHFRRLRRKFPLLPPPPEPWRCVQRAP